MAKKDEEVEVDFDKPPNSKIRIAATICIKLLDEMKNIHRSEVQDAKDHDRTEPDWSNTVEMLLRKGVRTYKSESKK